MISQVAWQIVVPAAILGILLRSRFQSRLDWLLNIAVLGSFLLFGFLTARWDWFSYYLRLVQVPLFAAASFVAFRRVRATSTMRDRPHRWREPAINIALLLVATWFNLGALRGYFYPGTPIALASPLRGGVYYVGGGGSSSWLNAHRVDDAPGNDYALDVVQLNGRGRRSNGLSPGDLTAYPIYGRPVHSPCTGTVAMAVDGVRDLTPPLEDGSRPAGNHVVIACQGVKVVIAHLMNGSIAVKGAGTVLKGEIVGRVGNSGRTSQPHLHLHAAAGGSPSGVLDGEGVPILIDGRFLVRNSLIRDR